jgi:hypothetical protein
MINARTVSILMTLLVAFVYLLVLTRGHLTVVPH